MKGGKEREGGSGHTGCHLVELIHQVALVLRPGQIVASGGEHAADAVFLEVVIVGQFGDIVDSPSGCLWVI